MASTIAVSEEEKTKLDDIKKKVPMLETKFTKIILKISLWLVPYFCLFGLAGSRSATLSPR